VLLEFIHDLPNVGHPLDRVQQWLHFVLEDLPA
jgi:hypothetical protein